MNKELTALKSKFDKVFVRHERTESGFGGRTVVHLVKDEHVFIGYALCHNDDQFNRHKGRQIAIGRALHAFGVHAGDKDARDTGENSGIGYLVYKTEGSKPEVIIDRYV